MYRNIAIAAAIVNNVLSQTNFQLVWNAHARGLLKFIKAAEKTASPCGCGWDAGQSEVRRLPNHSRCFWVSI